MIRSSPIPTTHRQPVPTGLADASSDSEPVFGTSSAAPAGQRVV